MAADYQSIRILSAVKEGPEGGTCVYLVYLTAAEWPRNDSTYKAKQEAYAAVDIIEVRPMKQNMVVVQAADRLTPNGVTSLAPVATNTTKEGRSKNRMVELVPH